MKQKNAKITIIVLAVLLALVSCALVWTIIELNNERAQATSRSPGNAIDSNNSVSTCADVQLPDTLLFTYTMQPEPLARFLSEGGNEKIKLTEAGQVSATPFQVDNMFPGDTKTKTYTVTVNDNTATTLTFSAVYVDNTVYNETDSRRDRDRSLMKIVVQANGTEIYRGKFDDISEINYPLNGARSVVYTITVSLDKRAGNEYARLDLGMTFNWSFAYEEMFTVTYNDGVDDAELFADYVVTVKKDDPTPVYPGQPTRDGYRFIGWEPNVADTITGNVTYKAKWERLYTVIYTDGVGGSAFADQIYANLVAGTDTPAFSGTPSREGYTFEGWIPALSDKVTANVTYTAQWKLIPVPVKYTVIYTDGVGGTVFANQTYTVTEGSATPAFSGTPSREGYTFEGWIPALSDKVMANVTYTAHWKLIPVPVKYTVVYTDGVGGTVFADQTYTVTEGSATPSFSGTPSREGYTFEGWMPAVADKVTKNVTYTAQWSQNVPETHTYTVIYTDGLGGIVFADRTYTVTEGSATPAFSGTPSREGYTFEGWTPVVADKVTANVTYTAQWKLILEQYTVIYTDGIGGAAFADQKYTVEEGSVTPAFSGTPSREGYTFEGWTPVVAEKVTANVTYTAQWKLIPVQYTVVYSDGIGGIAFANQTYTVKEGDATPAFNGTPSREGYTFEGWMPTVADKVTANVTYTAQWKLIPVPQKYTVIYTDGVGGIAFADQKYTVEEGSVTPSFSGTPSREGYTFEGWTPTVTDKVTANVTYTAQWKLIPVLQMYTVIYTDGMGGEAFANQQYTVEEGSATPKFNGTPRREGYTFGGWNPEVAETVTANVTYTAIWVEREKTSLIIDEENRDVDVIIVIENPRGGDEWTYDFIITVNKEEHYALYCGAEMAEDAGNLGDVLKITIVCKETGEVLYDGLLKDMPDRLRTELTGEYGEAYHYNVTLSLEPQYEDAYAAYVGKVKVKWWIEDEAVCRCILCRLVGTCICPWCWIILALLITSALLTTFYFVGQNKNKRIVADLVASGVAGEELKAKTYLRRQYIGLGIKTIATLFLHKKEQTNIDEGDDHDEQ